MSSIIKPRIPQIDWRNPITKGLIFDDPFHLRGGAVTFELASQLQGTIASSGATWDTNLFGVDLDFSAAASRVAYTTPTNLNSLGNISIEVLLYIRSNGGGSLGRIVHKKNNTKGYFALYTQTTTIAFDVGQSSSDDILTIPQPSLNTWHHLIVTSNVNSAPGNTSFILDGVLQTTTIQQSGTGGVVADDTNLYIGNRGDSIRNFDGKLAYTRLWNRRLTQTEAISLNQNPFRIYRQSKTGLFLPR